MPLKFPGAWRFKPPADGRFANQAVPSAAIEECIALIMRVATQGDRQDVLEHFKGYFAGATGSSHSRSSNASWAETDLWAYARSAAANAPLFIEAFYDACRSFATDDENWAPDVDMINEVLAKHRIGYVIKLPRLEAREDATEVVVVPPPPPSLAENAADVLQNSLTRAEELLSQGRGREAVQESLWLLETVTTAFRGLETATGTVEGKYFNRIVCELRDADSTGTLKSALDWIVGLHGYLSSPTGGGVRHGLDLNDGMPIDENAARLFCNLIRSYLSFLLVEHQRLARR
ncbi:MAG: hypothetical protein IMZ69_00340 [Spirochaetes bacterium]|nr:hypothetical protein [Spirochaetota bacterium]